MGSRWKHLKLGLESVEGETLPLTLQVLPALPLVFQTPFVYVEFISVSFIKHHLPVLWAELKLFGGEQKNDLSMPTPLGRRMLAG